MLRSGSWHAAGACARTHACRLSLCIQTICWRVSNPDSKPQVRHFARRVHPAALAAVAELFLMNGDMCAWLYTGERFFPLTTPTPCPPPTHTRTWHTWLNVVVTPLNALPHPHTHTYTHAHTHTGSAAMHSEKITLFEPELSHLKKAGAGGYGNSLIAIRRWGRARAAVRGRPAPSTRHAYTHTHTCAHTSTTDIV